MSDNALPQINDVVAAALREDAAASDATTAFLDLAGTPVRAEIVAGADGVIAGLEVAAATFAALDAATAFTPRCSDGDRVEPGVVIAQVVGDAGAVLPAERVALNFMQRLSGVATMTARFVDAVAGTGVTILDTRKTTPQLRALEKYAVTAGGGTNHRFNLSDMMLIKENHLRAAGGLNAVRRQLAERPGMRVEIEVDSIEMLDEASELAVDRIMLDNFTPQQVESAVKRVREKNSAIEIEVSGGVNLQNVRDYALPGVNFISIGALTHAASWLDMSLEVVVDGE